MDRGKKFFNNKVRPIFGKKPSRAERTRRGDNSAASTPSHIDKEHVVTSTENTTLDNRLGAHYLEVRWASFKVSAVQDATDVTALQRQNIDRKYSNDQQDIDSIENIHETQDIDPSTSNNRKHCGAAGHDADRELLIPSDLPIMAHPPSESMRFDDTKNSGISVGGGSVSVSNINSGNTTTVTGTFIQNNPTSERIRPGLELLQKRVAPSAFHNSIHRVSPPRCHPNTRVAIQKQIYDWIMQDLLIRRVWIMWMHGAAGGGKSAIMQSIAELCEKAEIPLASFFFFRTDLTRNSMTSFIATIVYQLIQKIPQIRDQIFIIIENNPLIFDESLESQLQKLIIQPLLWLQEHFKGFFIIMIDGLDECTERAHQVDLIKLLGTVSHSRSIPLIFLVASRREPQIEAAFVRKEISDLVLTLPLDNSDVEKTSDDIRHFLVDKFTDIKETHLLKRYLPVDWPAKSVIEEIITKSSGQFIFASVVISYLSSPRANPSSQLDIIRGSRLRDPSSPNPFAHLDALYQYIFSQVEACDKVFEIIAFYLLTDINYISNLGDVFLLGAGDLHVLFTDLTSVIQYNPDSRQLTFLHASLPDFLLDESRSEQYHIDLDEYTTKLLCMFLERRPLILDPLWSADNLECAKEQERNRLWAIWKLLKKAKASDRLRRALMNFSCTFYTKVFVYGTWYESNTDILQPLKQLDFNDQGEAYFHVKDMFATEYAKYWPSLDDNDKNDIKRDSPDLAVYINQIWMQAV